MAAMLFLILALIMISFLATPVVYSDGPAAGFRATMIRTEKAINFTQAARRSHERMSMLADRLDAASGSGRVTTQAPLQVDGAGYEYNMELSIGTPPQKLLAMADTGSDLTWIKCGACTNCTPAGGPSYYPGMSSFSMLPCSDRDLWLRRRGVRGVPRQRDLHARRRDDPVLGGEFVPGVGFGCTTVSEGIYIYSACSGIVGLGRGPLSLVSQLNVGAFSYCLSGGSTTSPLLFGSLAALTGAGVQSTPLLAGTGILLRQPGAHLGRRGGDRRPREEWLRHGARLRHDVHVPCGTVLHAGQGGRAEPDDARQRARQVRLRGVHPSVRRWCLGRFPGNGAALRRRRHGPAIIELLWAGRRRRRDVLDVDGAEIAESVHHWQRHAEGLPYTAVAEPESNCRRGQFTN
ncbi:unnamed protein product [Miscanthus lutarioriparius]|uniref:Peptidase A1 domain-containing protein n=1 Tax=Miscanthus lutarioriparius TaxID=422564 RepID=A0A811QGB0_9POAL|nr:unnamed protein product [Miscanthus lutarioriparius]